MSEPRIRVLFVDDEENNLKSFKSSFRREMDVLLASSGADALNMLETEEVHVIISDQRMPNMTGSEFLAIAKERFPRSMRMLLTGFADLEAVIAAVNEGGIFAYCTKPWDVNDLTLKIRQACETLTLREANETLLHRYRQIFNTSGDPVVIVDHRGAVLEANTACAKLLGISMEQMLATPFSDHLENTGDLLRSLKRHRIGTAFTNVDLTLKTASGSIIDCLMTATYLGKRTYGKDVFQAVIKDITDRNQEQKRLVKLNGDLDKRVAARTGQLLEALEDLGSFSYTVAHDLRSPLKNIAALSDHLLQQTAGQGERTESAELSDRINKSVVRMLALVDDLLRFSQTNTRELERRDVSLRALVEQVVSEQVAEMRLDQVRVDIDPKVTVLADAPMLNVAIQNLLSNALKFSRQREHPEIIISHSNADGRDVISVKDNGVGFDAQHKDQAFGVFKRLHKADQFEGTGVGLAIVHRIMAKHGGEAWAESTVGVGTTMYIALPTQAARAEHIPFIKVA